MLNREYPHLELKETNQMFIDRRDGDRVWLRVWYIEKGAQRMKLVKLDQQSPDVKRFRNHKNRISKIWQPGDDADAPAKGGPTLMCEPTRAGKGNVPLALVEPKKYSTY